MSYTLGELAERVGARVVGDAARFIDGVGTLHGAGSSQIAFLTNPRYRRYLAQTGAAAVILTEADVEHCPANALVSANPHATYARVAALFENVDAPQGGVHPSAAVDPSAQLAEAVAVGANAVIGPECVVEAGAIIGPGCVLGRGVRLGAGSRLVANVSIYAGCELGARCIVHAGAVIGSDGFGFANEDGHWLKVAQLGRVRIGDDVEIGACTTVDRGAVEDTVIEEGVKIDNLVQVAHNVQVGAHTAIAACVGIAGSTRIGRHCAIAGGVGILGHLEIADGVTITATSFVTGSVKKAGVYSSGTPLEPTPSWQKNYARFKQLDDMARRLRALERELNALKRGQP